MHSRQFPVRLDGLRSSLIASDPAFTRLRTASRVTLTLAATVAALFGAHLIYPMPTAAYGIAMVVAMQGALSIKDTTRRGRAATRVYGSVAGFGAIAVSIVLSPWPPAVDATFIVLVFTSVYARKYGVRSNAIGMFAFKCYFIGAYLRPAFADLPGIGIAILISGLVAHVVRATVLPENPPEEFDRATIATFERIEDLRRALKTGLRKGWTEARQREAHVAQNRVGEAILIAESYLPVESAETLDDDAGSAMAVALFDLHLISETALLAALASGKDDAPRRAAVLPPQAALDRLRTMANTMREMAGRLPDDFFERDRTAADKPAAVPERKGLLADPAFRLAVQVSLASAIAMTGGLFLSKTRWFWAILTAFLVFTNTQSRGDTALRALNRVAGTVLGIIIGISLATWLAGDMLVSSALIVIFVFTGFYLLQLSYGVMVFFVTIVLSLLYGLLGQFTPGLLVLRLEETLIGVAAGVFIAFAVFPQKTRDATDRATDAFLSALDRVLAAAASGIEKGRPGTGVRALARHVDRRQVDLVAAARPLGSNWRLVRRPGPVRRTLLGFAAAAYWTRLFSSTLSAQDLDGDRAAHLALSISALRARIERARADGTHVFDTRGRSEPAAAGSGACYADPGAGPDDPLFALDALSRVLDRILPETGST